MVTKVRRNIQRREKEINEEGGGEEEDGSRWRPVSRRWMDSVGIQPDIIHLRLEERGGPAGFYFGTRSSIMFTGILIRSLSPSSSLSYHRYRRIVPSYGDSRKSCFLFFVRTFLYQTFSRHQTFIWSMTRRKVFGMERGW